MALSFDLSKVKDLEKKYPFTSTTNSEGKKVTDFNDVTNAIIFGTIFVGMGEITEKTAEEFYIRFRMQELMLHSSQHLASRYKEGFILKPGSRKNNKARYRGIKYQEVKDHIGLKTNVTFVPKRSFHASVTRILRSRAEEGLPR